MEEYENREKREQERADRAQQLLEERAEQEERRAQERIAKAQRKEEKKQAKMEAQAERERQRLERQAERKAEQRERELRAEEARQHHRAERAVERLERERAREEGRQKKPGYGGWLAAVVSLSVAVLALGAIVTVGYFDLTRTKGAALDGYHESLYELSEQVEALDADLAKVRVAKGRYETQKLLTDVLVRCRLAERCLENFPVEGYSAARLTAYFNRSGDYAQALLNKLAAGGTLSAQESETLEYLYNATESMRYAMPALLESAQTSSAEDMWKADGDFVAKFEQLSAGLDAMPEGMRTAGVKGERMLDSLDALSEEDAMQRANAYFAQYKVKDLRCTGKSEGDYAVYTFEFGDEAGNAYYAQITQKGGMLSLFESHASCAEEKFDARHCGHIAREFLKNAGYEGLRPVWMSKSDNVCCITFVSEQDGVLIYPDRILVKVCCERGAVTGMDAQMYLKNHAERTIAAGKVSMEKVERNAAAKMNLHGVCRAIIPVDGQERLTYEVRGEYGGRMYFAYIDAMTGETAEIRVVTETDRGMSLL